MAEAARKARGVPWTTRELEVLVEAWEASAAAHSASEGPQVATDTYKRFVGLQGGRSIRKASALISKRSALRFSYRYICEFNAQQQRRRAPPFFDLPYLARQAIMRDWRRTNNNIVEISGKMFDGLARFLPDDAPGEAAAAAASGNAAVIGAAGNGAAAGDAAASKATASSSADDDGSDASTDLARLPPPPRPSSKSVAKAEAKAASTPVPKAASKTTSKAVPKPTQKAAQPKPAPRMAATAPAKSKLLAGSVTSPMKSSTTEPTKVKPSAGGVIKPHRYITPASSTSSGTGGNGRRWSDEELSLCVQAWEIAVTKLLEKREEQTLSISQHLFSEYSKLQGGDPTRNRSALASKRSALKFSCTHIVAYNDAQEKLSQPRYSTLSDDARQAVMRQWRNSNAVDMSEDLLTSVTRIVKIEDKVMNNQANARAASKVAALSSPLPAISIVSHDTTNEEPAREREPSPRVPAWTQKESWDLIRACADVAAVESGTELAPIQRETRIYDRFVAARATTAGSAAVPRDLKALAKQWQCILASYAFIKTYNDGSAINGEPVWFNLNETQKRAYERCSSPPRRFVDMDAEMFELVTSTSFPINSVIDPEHEQGQTSDNSDSGEHQVSSVFKPAARIDLPNEMSPALAANSPTSPSIGDGRTGIAETQPRRGRPPSIKGNAWTDSEIQSLLRAWKIASKTYDPVTTSVIVPPTYKHFIELEGSGTRRTMAAVRAKMISLRSSFIHLSRYNAGQKKANGPSWFDQSESVRLQLVRAWKNTNVVDLTKKLFSQVSDICWKHISSKRLKAKPLSSKAPPVKSTRATVSPSVTDENSTSQPAARASGTISIDVDAKPTTSFSRPQDSRSRPDDDEPIAISVAKVAKVTPRNQPWGKRELLLLARACNGLLEDRSNRRYLTEEQKDQLYQKYRELGGSRQMSVAVARARTMIDSYDFICSFDKNAASNNWPKWFELEVNERATITTAVCNVHSNFNGIAEMDEDLMGFISRMDAASQLQDSANKKKRYTPSTDRVGKARYGDPEDAAAAATDLLSRRHDPRADLMHRVRDSRKRAVDTQSESESDDISSSPASSESDGDRSEEVRRHPSRRPRGPRHRLTPTRQPPTDWRPHSRIEDGPRRKKRRRQHSPAIRGDGDFGASSAFIIDLIQKQNDQFERLLERFRRDRARDRKEFFDSLYSAIQERLPADTGNGSYLERLVERQSQSMADMFHRVEHTDRGARDLP